MACSWTRRSGLGRSAGHPGGRAELDREIHVHCYAGHRGEQTPRRFTLGERQVEVVEVVDAWLDPDHRYFKVTGDDGFDYLLRHDARGDCWRLVGSEAPDGREGEEIELYEG